MCKKTVKVVLPVPPSAAATAFAKQKRSHQKEETPRGVFLLFGDPAGIRTPDPLLKRQLLCRLSYRIGYSFLLFRGLAGTAGLEPANEGVKVPCLTTWLRPNVKTNEEDRGRPDPLVRMWGG